MLDLGTHDIINKILEDDHFPSELENKMIEFQTTILHRCPLLVFHITALTLCASNGILKTTM